MKIICDSCGAKYSIADEKVQGKVFKIRCKKCSEVIVVEGTSVASGGGGVDDYQSPYEDEGASEWYVVIDGERVGPVTAGEVEGYFSAGQLHAESYIWKDGLDDWVMLETVDAFGHLLQESAGPNEKTMISDNPLHEKDRQEAAEESPGEREGMEAAGVELGGGGGDATAVMNPDNFRQQAEAQQAAMADQTVESSGLDMGGGANSGDAGYDQGGHQGVDAGGSGGWGDDGADGSMGQGAASQEEPYVEQPQEQGGFGAPVGQDGSMSDGGGFEGGGGYDGAADYDDGGYDDGGYDSEDGGMFAAFDDEEESYDEPETGGGGLDLGGGGSGDGGGEEGEDLVAARNENSVLFSLSSVDQVEAVNKQDGQGSAANDKSGLIDIQSLASSHVAMGEGGASDDEDEEFVSGTMSMPAMMPSGSQKSNTGLIVGISVAVALLLAIVGGVVVYLLLAEDDDPVEMQEDAMVAQQEEEEEDEEEDEELAAAEAARQAAEEEEDEEDEEEVAEEEEDDEEEEEEAVAQAEPSGQRATGGGSGSGGGSAPSPSPTPQPEPEPEPEPQQQQGGGGILSDLDRQSEPEPEEEPAEELPERLSRSDVQGTIRRYNSQVSACSRDSNPDGLSGNATVRFVVTGSGNVSSADAQGEFAGTEVGNCIEGVVEGMRFPETQDDRRTINYPFSVR